MSQKLASNILGSIQRSKTRPLSCLLYALGIRQVGEHTAEVLADAFGSIERIMNASLEELATTHEVGRVTAESIVSCFSDPANREMVLQLEEAGVHPTQSDSIERSDALAGKTIVFTGTLERMPRPDAEKLAKSAGARVSGSVSKATSFVVAGETPGSKMNKAQELGVAVLSEDQFFEMIKGSGCSE